MICSSGSDIADAGGAGAEPSVSSNGHHDAVENVEPAVFDHASEAMKPPQDVDPASGRAVSLQKGASPPSDITVNPESCFRGNRHQAELSPESGIRD